VHPYALAAVSTLSCCSDPEPVNPRTPEPSVRLKRLEALADLWGKVYLFHPAIVTPSPQPSPKGRGELNDAGPPSPTGRGKQGEGAELDWNQALIRAIPRVEAAETPGEMVNAINEELLQPLGDPLTFACLSDSAAFATTQRALIDAGRFEARRLSESIGYVRAPVPPARGPSFLTDFQTAVESLGEVATLVVDLRWPAAIGYRMNDPILEFFTRTALLTGPVMNRVHEGWNEDNGFNAYRQKWEVIAGARLHPIQEPDWYLTALTPGTDFRQLKTIVKPTVFLVNRPSAVRYYKILDALQSQPGIAVVFESSGPPEEVLHLRLEYDAGLAVQLNTERLVGHDGQAGFLPDLVVDRPIGPDQLAAIAEQALAAGTRDQGLGTRDKAAELINLNLPAPLSEAKASLTREERLLGLFKLWNVIRYLYPHLDLCDIDWHSCLPEWIPRFEEADSLVAYARTIRMLTAHLHDSGVLCFYPGLPEPQALPVAFRWVEGKIIVTDLVPEALTAHGSQHTAVSRLEIGDELVEFDGKTLPELIAEHRLQLSYSTESAFYRRMCEMLCFGRAGSEVKLVVRRSENGDATAASSTQPPRGSVPFFARDTAKTGTVPGNRTGPCEGTVPVLRTLTLKRTIKREQWVSQSIRAHEPQGYRLLDGNLGYLNLCRLSSLAEFDGAFEALHRADGLIIDIRGYPGFTMQLALSARLSEQPVKSAIFEIPVVSNYERLEQGWNIGQYEVQPDPGIQYGGPVVVLVDEKTRGSSEDLCIYLKNINRVSFVGEPTSGCNGNRTWLSLPGGGRLFFTGMRVKFGDGSRFQNVGILPNVPAAPTVAGIRAGRDEVLEKAIAVLTAGKPGAQPEVRTGSTKTRGTRAPRSPRSRSRRARKTRDDGREDKGLPA